MAKLSTTAPMLRLSVNVLINAIDRNAIVVRTGDNTDKELLKAIEIIKENIGCLVWSRNNNSNLLMNNAMKNITLYIHGEWSPFVKELLKMVWVKPEPGANAVYILNLLNKKQYRNALNYLNGVFHLIPINIESKVKINETFYKVISKIQKIQKIQNKYYTYYDFSTCDQTENFAKKYRLSATMMMVA
jgi:hypothetical protein